MLISNISRLCGTAKLGVFMLASCFAHSAWTDAPSGAIFTTLVDGSEVNFNHYASKLDVYLDGGPGPGAPASAAGLDAGIYVFQVTDPSGKTLLSSDIAACRRFEVDDQGLIVDVVPAGGCEHMTGVDIDQGAATVQLMPYLDTPNNGGVYKVWVTTVADFLAGCAALGQPDGLNVVDCQGSGRRAAGNFHGFVASDSKTDNFKVGDQPIVEIDTRFRDEDTGQLIDGLMVTWVDTLGGSNKKWSYFAPELLVNHEAHVEGVEVGYHQIKIEDQPGCYVHDVYLIEETDRGWSDREWVMDGPGTVFVRIKSLRKNLTVFIDVDCHSQPVDH